MTVLSSRQLGNATGAVVPPGGPLIGQEYLRIYDQAGRIWYWWVSYDLASDWGQEPESPFDQEVRLFMVPWWLFLRDTDGDAWYVYPDMDGAPLSVPSQPATGEGVTGSPSLRVRGGRLRYKYDILGGDVNVVSV